MINRHRSTKPKTQPRLVASFGRATLVRIAGSNCELRGASDDDFTAAKEWVSLFLHEACVERCDAPIPHRRATSNSRWNVSSLGKSE
jgi:hypothetical protein